MKILQVKLNRFKRFTNTTVQEIPSGARLVIIAGPNGCGKSSFFEALNVWARMNAGRGGWGDPNYFIKDPEQGDHGAHQAVQVIAKQSDLEGPIDPRKAVYIRSAYRNDPDFQISALQRMGSTLDDNRLSRMIENDAAVSQNYQRMASQALEDVFENEAAATTVGDFRTRVIGDIKAATLRLFPDLVMNGLGNPLTSGTFRFDKGTSKGFLYKNLSGGEKAAFDLLLDIIIKRREYDDTVFCIDEPEAHMGSRLQGDLLKELYNAMGDHCQLWLATHSIGMMRRARDLEQANPGTVVFLDFGDRDFDEPQTITPEVPNRAFWERVLDIAFDDFAALIAPSQIIICEGSPLGNGGSNESTDAKCYDEIFSVECPDTRFISAGNAHGVENDRLALVRAMESLVRGTKIRRLIDRDDLSPEEVADKAAQGLTVLKRRNIENYLFDDEVLRALCVLHGRESLADEIVAHKYAEMAKATTERDRPVDDVKASAGPIYVNIKRKLRLTRCGNSAKEFMRSTIAPMICPEMEIYKELKADIFDSN